MEKLMIFSDIIARNNHWLRKKISNFHRNQTYIKVFTCKEFTCKFFTSKKHKKKKNYVRESTQHDDTVLIPQNFKKIFRCVRVG
jgi:hypothetical protein